ncbi:BspA family leucine-rich repeat surface protein [Pediococcus acidilactici]|uniref:Bacterial surface protein 26-residue PARCEL repeat (3 repeats) n=2 Tax=Pediococcus acidilactici TaxID=1254 RepID=E0NGN5_PEDAC|nr:BspA family leucine-rich repeat surface protein [Pediococcus acidilactici]AZP91359.1 BspA family leucine-rich repeat surface protein [Pediococcus acidilactici]EFL95345.1 bacterial surface protein 26-residue PARCEL repeat (3 repeats) [Pediococcus acidilactici DSM 20284]KRN16691.1 surface protein [Pediococcus acidilactici]MDG9738652.1 BspA family leucine-rich repeat surface protein [Pediococcus acidilactici]NKZ16719.1 BspA family leucine-rich repeat surface protein [Pediococcus acidilactici]
MTDNLRYIIKKSLVITGAIIATLLITTQLAMAAQKNVRGTAIEWGDSTWLLADDGELQSAGGDIGQAPPLHDVLSNNGIDLERVKSIEFTKATSAHDITDMLGNLPNLQKITKLGNLDYSGSAEQMFRDDSMLKIMDIKDFNTSKINNMTYMFWNTAFDELDLGNFDTSQVTNMTGMFDGTGNLKKLDLRSFDTSNVKNMKYMFYNSNVSEVNLSSFDTSNVTDMMQMFLETKNLTNLDLSNFDTSNVNSMNEMFVSTTNLKTVNMSNWDTSKVTNMNHMFSNSGVEKLDLSSFTITNDMDTADMFIVCRNLKQLTLGKKSQLKSNMNIPDVPTTDGYTGHWQNVGNGTVDDPAGNHVWTSTELMSNFDAPTMGDDTFVWQRKPATINTGETTDYKNDPVLSKYVPTAVDPLHPYRYNVVLNNDYPFYTKVEDGQTKKDNVANLGDKSGTTVYSQAEMPATYTYATGKRAGQATKFIKVSFDGNQWYWVDQHALNLDLKSRYPAVNEQGVSLIDDQFLGSTNTYGIISGDFNSQMIDNAYNPDGQIIYQSFAKESDFANEKDPAQALKAFNDNLDRAAKSWNDALGQSVLIKATDTNKKVTLKVIANPQGAGSATLSGNTGIDASLVEKGALDPDGENYDINVLFITMRHELGHSLGLNHTSNGQYYGMPDGYRMNIDDDAMNAILVYDKYSFYPYSQKTVTPEDIDAVKLIIANHNFENPQPQTKKVVTTKQIDRAVSKT